MPPSCIWEFARRRCSTEVASGSPCRPAWSLRSPQSLVPNSMAPNTFTSAFRRKRSPLGPAALSWPLGESRTPMLRRPSGSLSTPSAPL
eukprot:3541539-Pyramimonas_sp.AAC.1